MITFLMFWQAEVDIPARDQDHVVSQVLPLDLGLLHDDNISFKNIEHGLEVEVQISKEVTSGLGEPARSTNFEGPRL